MVSVAQGTMQGAVCPHVHSCFRFFPFGLYFVQLMIMIDDEARRQYYARGPGLNSSRSASWTWTWTYSNFSNQGCALASKRRFVSLPPRRCWWEMWRGGFSGQSLCNKVLSGIYVRCEGVLVPEGGLQGVGFVFNHLMSVCQPVCTLCSAKM